MELKKGNRLRRAEPLLTREENMAKWMALTDEQREVVLRMALSAPAGIRPRDEEESVYLFSTGVQVCPMCGRVYVVERRRRGRGCSRSCSQRLALMRPDVKEVRVEAMRRARAARHSENHKEESREERIARIRRELQELEKELQEERRAERVAVEA